MRSVHAVLHSSKDRGIASPHHANLKANPNSLNLIAQIMKEKNNARHQTRSSLLCLQETKIKNKTSFRDASKLHPIKIHYIFI
jgi:hypothetical protein